MFVGKLDYFCLYDMEVVVFDPGHLLVVRRHGYGEM